MPPRSQILHADMDAFYASIEQRDRPELRGKPVVVGGTGNRGVVSAASYEARRFGVRSAMPTAQARQLCPQAVFLSGDMSKYVSESRRIFEIFRDVAPSVEGLSLDEAFLDLTGTERLLGPARGVAEDLRERIREQTGLAVSVGIAPVKMVAKIASAAAKPDGVLEVPANAVREFLEPLPVRAIWGVGPVAAERLERAGFVLVGDLARAAPQTLQRRLGDWGLRLAQLARGEDLRELEPYRDARSYSEENTFAADVTDRSVLDAAILSHAESVARRIRRDQMCARTVVLKWRSARRRKPGPRGYPLHTRRSTLPQATDDGAVIATEAKALLDRAALSEPVRLVGVAVANIVSRGQAQLALFDLGGREELGRRRRLNSAVDEIVDRFGSRAIARAGESRVERAALTSQIKRGEDPIRR